MIPDFYLNNDKESFAFATCRERWPTILKDASADVAAAAANSTVSASAASHAAKIVSAIDAIAAELHNDKPLTSFSDKDCKEIPGLSSYNATLAEFKAQGYSVTWLTAPWLFTECYLYRRVDAAIKQFPGWDAYDVFHNKKQHSFRTTAAAVGELATRFRSISETRDLDSAPVLFKEFIDVCLWGNKIDLSLLANKKQEEVHSGQTSESRREAEENIVANDTDKIWQKLKKGGPDCRVDIILDNSGFETFTDLVFMSFLLDFGLCSHVVVHCKTRPWMVSDTMIKDIDILLQDLDDSLFFPENREALTFVSAKIRSYIKSSKITIVDSEFWTLDLDYWHLSPQGRSELGRRLYAELIQAAVVFVKGDLNYRKLTGDRKWPKTTKFVDAIGPLKGGIPIASLRTCKADVCVGLPEGLEEKLVKEWHEKTGELGQFWSNSGNWAVISYNG